MSLLNFLDSSLLYTALFFCCPACIYHLHLGFCYSDRTRTSSRSGISWIAWFPIKSRKDTCFAVEAYIFFLHLSLKTLSNQANKIVSDSLSFYFMCTSSSHIVFLLIIYLCLFLKRQGIGKTFLTKRTLDKKLKTNSKTGYRDSNTAVVTQADYLCKLFSTAQYWQLEPSRGNCLFTFILVCFPVFFCVPSVVIFF